MLLFGDLHINARFCDRIINTMNDWILKNPDEQNLIFLGDYVYHFSYDRESLLKLYSFFLQLYEMGKNVYILAGNHDWLGNTFVFEEAKRTYEIISKINENKAIGKIEFITKPKLEVIEGKKCLFLPYCLGFDDELASGDLAKDIKLDSSVILDAQKDKNLIEIESTVNTLSKSQNKNEKFSANLNKLLLNSYKENNELIVFHHYYTEGVSFPGQKGRFYFNDVALSHLFCELEGLKLISGHLHQGFSYKNYFCVGSVWNTSPLEINQAKMLFKYSNDAVTGNIIFINPYFQLENLDKNFVIDESFLKIFEKNIIQENIGNYESQNWNIKIQSEYELKNKDVSILLKVDDIDYDNIYSYIDENTFKNLKDVKLKKNFAKAEDLFEKMDIEGKNLTSGFSDWKGLLKEYLNVKYPQEYDKYIDFLKKEKII